VIVSSANRDGGVPPAWPLGFVEDRNARGRGPDSAAAPRIMIAGHLGGEVTGDPVGLDS
jgi:hypothetical protein